MYVTKEITGGNWWNVEIDVHRQGATANAGQNVPAKTANRAEKKIDAVLHTAMGSVE